MGTFSPGKQPGRQNEKETLKVCHLSSSLGKEKDIGKEKGVVQNCVMDKQMEEVVKRPRQLCPVGLLLM